MTNTQPSAAEIEADALQIARRLKEHVEHRGGPSGNGVWQLMLDAANQLVTMTARIAGCGEPCRVCHTTSGEHAPHCSAAGDGLDRLMAERNEWRRRAGTLEAALLDGCVALRAAEPGRRMAALRNMEAALAKLKEPS